jgi:hypothetical protein
VTAKSIKVGHLVGEAPVVRRRLPGKYFLMPGLRKDRSSRKPL